MAAGTDGYFLVIWSDFDSAANGLGPTARAQLVSPAGVLRLLPGISVDARAVAAREAS